MHAKWITEYKYKKACKRTISDSVRTKVTIFQKHNLITIQV